MSPLLKNLLGHGDKDREIAEEMRTLLAEMQQERDRCRVAIQNTRSATERLEHMGEPVAKAGSDVDAMTARLAELDRRLASLAAVAERLQSLDGRAEGLTQSHEQAAAAVARTLAETEQIRARFDELAGKVDLAVDLKDRLTAFLEVEKPFAELRGQADAVRAHVDGTGEQLARFREQHERLADAHKLAVQKLEALEHRRDVLGRELTDKERRVATVDQSVRSMDGIQSTIAEIKREIGALKALGDSVVQKTAALEAQRDAVERALGQAENLDRAMKQMDAGVRQQQANEKTLATLQDAVASLKALHESVIERSGEITQLQRETDERTRATREDLGTLTEQMKKTVDRFEFEGRGLETVTQRVADLRASLTDAEHRFQALSEPSLAVGSLRSETRALTSHVGTLVEQVGEVDQEIGKFLAIRRDLDEASRSTQDIAAQLGRIEEARPGLDAALRDLGQLGAADAMVKDAIEQTRNAGEELGRLRASQAETRSWLSATTESLARLREQVDALNALSPAVEAAQKQAQRLGESVAALESRRQGVEDLQKRTTDLGALVARLEERDRALQTRIEQAEQRFVPLAASSEDAERLTSTIAAVASDVTRTERRSAEVSKEVAEISARCESVEELAEKTRALRPELDQRQHALAEAIQDLQQASALRKDAAAATQKLEELSRKITATLATADRRASLLTELSTELEGRAAGLRGVGKRLAEFEERLAKWEAIDKDVTRSLDQISSRQGTIEALEADLDRMFTTLERTTAEMREVTGSQQEVQQSRALLAEVLAKLQEVRKTAKSLDERNRQVAKAEERLARADALLVDVRTSLEALQGQKTLVEQAVERAGSLQFLLKQADAAIEGLRGEREMTARVNAALGMVGEEEEDEEERAA